MSDKTLNPHALPITPATCYSFKSLVFLLLRNPRAGREPKNFSKNCISTSIWWMFVHVCTSVSKLHNSKMITDLERRVFLPSDILMPYWKAALEKKKKRVNNSRSLGWWITVFLLCVKVPAAQRTLLVTLETEQTKLMWVWAREHAQDDYTTVIHSNDKPSDCPTVLNQVSLFFDLIMLLLHKLISTEVSLTGAEVLLWNTHLVHFAVVHFFITVHCQGLSHLHGGAVSLTADECGGDVGVSVLVLQVHHVSHATWQEELIALRLAALEQDAVNVPAWVANRGPHCSVVGSGANELGLLVVFVDAITSLPGAVPVLFRQLPLSLQLLLAQLGVVAGW
ncbi:hypothetical protein JZ751_022489, partial [Albula glossodonta]